MAELRPARELSKTIFGPQDRLRTACIVATYGIEPPEPFRQTDIFARMFRETDGAANAGQIGKELSVFAMAGVIVRRPELDTGSSVYYSRVESSFWPFIQELAEQTIELSGSRHDETMGR